MSDLWLTEVAPRDVGNRQVLSFSDYPDRKPLTSGTGPLNVLCARCSFVLLDRVEPGDIHFPDRLVRCPACGTLNAAGRSVLSSDT